MFAGIAIVIGCLGLYQNFAYHIDLSAGIFVAAIMASFVIAALTIASQTIKAARANPVKALKSE